MFGRWSIRCRGLGDGLHGQVGEQDCCYRAGVRPIVGASGLFEQLPRDKKVPDPPFIHTADPRTIGAQRPSCGFEQRYETGRRASRLWAVSDRDVTREQLVDRLAEVSHKTYLRQKARNDPPADPTGQAVTAHDRERAEDTVAELERLGILRLS